MSAFSNAQKPELEKKGLNIQSAIPVVEATTIPGAVVVSFGDGTVRFSDLALLTQQLKPMLVLF